MLLYEKLMEYGWNDTYLDDVYSCACLTTCHSEAAIEPFKNKDAQNKILISGIIKPGDEIKFSKYLKHQKPFKPKWSLSRVTYSPIELFFYIWCILKSGEFKPMNSMAVSLSSYPDNPPVYLFPYDEWLEVDKINYSFEGHRSAEPLMILKKGGLKFVLTFDFIINVKNLYVRGKNTCA